MRSVKRVLRKLRSMTVAGAPTPPAVNQPDRHFRQDFSEADRAMIERVRPFTMTGPERVVSLTRAVEYLVRNNIYGSIVECGVWRGGSMMCVAYTLLRLGVTDRDLYLFDTFEGMPPPEGVDVLYDGTSAVNLLAASAKESAYWAYSNLDEVRSNLRRTDYPEARLHFVKGKVEDTIPVHAPDGIALLRLDTDWYASTRHELIHLYPRLRTNGVLIIDDYGWWQGARQAVDEYMDGLEFAPLLHRIDETGRACIKATDDPARDSSRARF